MPEGTRWRSGNHDLGLRRRSQVDGDAPNRRLALGHHPHRQHDDSRLEALRLLGWTVVPVTVVTLENAEQLQRFVSAFRARL